VTQSGERKAPGFDPGVLVIAALLCIAGAVIVWGAWSAPAAGGYARIGPTAAPWVVGSAMLALGLATAVSALRGAAPPRERQEIKPVLWIVGGLAAQMLLLKPLGFSIATGLLFAATAKAFGRGPLWMTIPLGCIFAFIVWVAFAKGLRLSLPAGPIESLL
jgi:putative tricarboxylic transport membrane protein